MASKTAFSIVRAIVNAMAKWTLTLSRHIFPSDAIERCKTSQIENSRAGSAH
jgi:hypothetical protein